MASRSKRDRIQRHPIATQSGFSLGAAYDVIPIVLIEIGPRFAHDFVEIVEFARSGGIGRGPGFIGILTGHRSVHDLRIRGIVEGAQVVLWLL